MTITTKTLTSISTVSGAWGGTDTVGNLNADDAAYAAITGATKNATIGELAAGTFSFDGDIDLSSTITKVEIIVVWKVSTTGSVANLETAYAISGTPGTYQTDSAEPITDTERIYDVTSLRAWTPADLMDAVFTVRLRARQGNSTTSVVYSFDYVAVRVTHVLPPLGGESGWWTADALTLNDGDPVASWQDEMGANPFIQGTSANRPTYQTAEINSLPCIRFDGVDDFLTADGLASIAAGADNDWTLFVVRKAVDMTAERSYLTWGNNATSPPVVICGCTSTAPHRMYKRDDGSGAASCSSYVGGNSNWQIITNRHRGVHSNVYVNGAVYMHAAQDVGTLTLNLFTAGCLRRAANSNFFEGDIAEIILYPTSLSASAQDIVEDYLATKYGITLEPPLHTETRWWRADLQAGTNGDPVSRLHDASGNESELTQPTGTNQPTFQNNQINGKPSVRFDGVDDYLINDATAGAIFSGIDQDWTVFVVRKGDSVGTNLTHAAAGSSSSDTPVMQLMTDTNTDWLQKRRDDTAAQASLNGGTPDTSWHIITHWFSGTTGEVFVDGVSVASGAQDVGAVTVNQFTVGALRKTGIYDFLDGDIAEIIIYLTALSGTNRAIVEAYLNAKYAIYSSGPTYTVTLAGNQPASTGALTRILQAKRSLAGSQPFATGSLTRKLQGLRALSGNQPFATGALARRLQAFRSLDGNQPFSTGELTRLVVVLRMFDGNQPAASGDLTRRLQALRSLTGDQPAATGDLARMLQADRTLEGNQPSSTGDLTRRLQAFRALDGNQNAPSGELTRLVVVLRFLTGNQPAATGDLTRVLHAFRALEGNQPTATGDLSRSAGAFTRSLNGNQPAATGDLTRALRAFRALEGNQPAPSGELTRLVVVLRMFEGNQPAATGDLTRVLHAFRSLDGNQPADSGEVSRILMALRVVEGNQPAATGELAAQMVGAVTRSLEGNQPAATGELTRRLQALRTLAGDQPAASGDLTRTYAGYRSLAGNQPASTGDLARLLHAFRSLAGDQLSASGVLLASLSVTRALTGNQPFATGELTRILQARRALEGSQLASTGVLSRAYDGHRMLEGSQPAATGLLSRALDAHRALEGNQDAPTGDLLASKSIVRFLDGEQPAPSGELTRFAQMHRVLTGDQPASTGDLTRLGMFYRALVGNQPAGYGILLYSLNAGELEGLFRPPFFVLLDHHGLALVALDHLGRATMLLDHDGIVTVELDYGP